MSQGQNRKIAFFVEGKTELSFLSRFLLPLVYGYNNISIECFPPKESYNCGQYNYINQNCSIEFIIKDVGADNAVLSAINKIDNKKNYNKIFGLRDAKSEVYNIYWKRKYPNKKIDVDIDLVKQIKDDLNKEIGNENAKIYFSIMEIEAWLLAFYKVYIKINKLLTLEYIEKKIGYNLETADSQEIMNPATQLKKLEEIGYKKGFPGKILKHLDKKDVDDLRSGNKISSFFELCDDLFLLKSKVIL